MEQLNTVGILLLAVFGVLLAAKVRSLTQALDSLVGLLRRVEELERNRFAAGGWVDGVNPLKDTPVKEDEWVPPVSPAPPTPTPRRKRKG